MRRCRERDGSPNALLAVLLAKAARRFDPACDKPFTVSVIIDHKAMLGSRDNYRFFAGQAILDFPKSRQSDPLEKACTIARGLLMLQAKPENSLWGIKQRRLGVPPPSFDTPLASICVSYPSIRSFGPLDPYIDELYIATTLLKITDILCEVTCIGHRFFLAFMQPSPSDRYLRCFMEELRLAGIPCELHGSEPLRMCGIEPMREPE